MLEATTTRRHPMQSGRIRHFLPILPVLPSQRRRPSGGNGMLVLRRWPGEAIVLTLADGREIRVELVRPRQTDGSATARRISHLPGFERNPRPHFTEQRGVGFNISPELAATFAPVGRTTSGSASTR